MPFSGQLRIEPLSLARFIKAYDISIDVESNVQAYAIYLDTNEAQHHYGIYDNKRDWLIHETIEYVKGK